MVNDNGSITTTDYAGNFIYENNVLQFFNTAEGYVEPNGSGGYNYVYQYKDHLGNIRLSYQDKNNDGTITASTEIVEENNYYPFGLKQKGYNTNINGRHHKYMFGGKEQQDELGLNWYDITARNYDPALGRWMNLDPLAAKRIWLSPYNYVQNNPLLRIDPNGLSDYTFDKKTGKFVLIKTTKDKYDRVLKTKKNGRLKKNKKGFKEDKRFGHITQGILKNGINFRTTRQRINVNGKNKDGTSQPTTKQVGKFLVNLAKVEYKEIASLGLVNSKGAEKKLLTLAYKKK